MSDPVAVPAELRALVDATMHAHWREPGFTCPNAERYPWLWLWDSCFHALIWQRLGDTERALAELRAVFAGQDVVSGFVPHMGYFGAPDTATDFWGRPGFSSITQPPMFGHAVAELVRDGVDVPDDLLGAARRGLWFLLRERRRHPTGLVELVHPWESGADDSPRWDDLAGATYSLDAWFRRKGALLAGIERSASGAPIANAEFGVGSTAFNALIAFNAIELASLGGDDDLAIAGHELTDALEARWDAELVTWIDAGPAESGSGRARTAEALLAVLVAHDDVAVDAALDSLVDPSAHRGRFGPAGVHRREATFDASGYWRGPAWPQLSYLLWVAASARGRDDVAGSIAASTLDAATRTGLAEYWDPDTGAGGGAVPQSWTGLALLMG